MRSRIGDDGIVQVMVKSGLTEGGDAVSFICPVEDSIDELREDLEFEYSLFNELVECLRECHMQGADDSFVLGEIMALQRADGTLVCGTARLQKLLLEKAGRDFCDMPDAAGDENLAHSLHLECVRAASELQF